MEGIASNVHANPITREQFCYIQATLHVIANLKW